MWWPLTGMHDPQGNPVPGKLGTPRVDTAGFNFQLIPADISELNERARSAADLDITAISAHAYPEIRNTYAITSCGASMGEGFGPKVVVRADSPLRTIEDLRSGDPLVATPGARTTAFLVFSLLMGRRPRYEAMRFDRVIGAVLGGRFDAGLLIHEAQLTFEQQGLRLITDLGAWWAQSSNTTSTTNTNATKPETKAVGGEDTWSKGSGGEGAGRPLPLGLNAIRRDLDNRFGPTTCARITRVLTDSIRYAVEHPHESREYLLMHAGDRPEWRDDALVERYLKMYVSQATLDMGTRGRDALQDLLTRGAAAGFCDDPGEIDIVRPA